MKKFLTRKLNSNTHNTTIVIQRMNGDLEFRKKINSYSQIYKGVGVNSKGAASIFLVMAVLAAVLAIALGSSFVVSTEIRSSSDSGESIVAYYAAETGIEEALYDRVNLGREPLGNRCAGVCNAGNAACCAEGWNIVGDANYCLNITETVPCDYTTITKIQSIGEYKSTRRSIEVSF